MLVHEKKYINNKNYNILKALNKTKKTGEIIFFMLFFFNSITLPWSIFNCRFVKNDIDGTNDKRF